MPIMFGIEENWQVEIKLETVRSVFHDLLHGRMTREAADQWACDVMQHQDNGSLIYSPFNEEDRIWDGVKYLYGVDVQVAPGEYLHTDEDIGIAMVKILGGAQ